MKNKLLCIRINGYRASGIYEAAIATAYDVNDPSYRHLFTMAEEIDRLNRHLVDMATDMAHRFAEYAQQLKSSRALRTPPTGYSTIRDIDNASAKVEALRGALFVAAGSAWRGNVDLGKEFRDALEKLDKAVSAARDVEEASRWATAALNGGSFDTGLPQATITDGLPTTK